jgi:hypothetical protein
MKKSSERRYVLKILDIFIARVFALNFSPAGYIFNLKIRFPGLPTPFPASLCHSIPSLSNSRAGGNLMH